MRRSRSWIAEPLEGRELLSGVIYSLTTDQPNYQVGQPIEMTFTETNTGDQPVTVAVSPRGLSPSQWPTGARLPGWSGSRMPRTAARLRHCPRRCKRANH